MEDFDFTSESSVNQAKRKRPAVTKSTKSSPVKSTKSTKVITKTAFNDSPSEQPKKRIKSENVSPNNKTTKVTPSKDQPNPAIKRKAEESPQLKEESPVKVAKHVIVKSEQPKQIPKTSTKKTPTKPNERNTLSSIIQKSLDSLDVSSWPESKGYTLREKCRALLTQAFMKQIPPEFSDNVEDYTNLVNSIVWALESSVYDNYFVCNPKCYNQTIRALQRHIPRNPIRFLTIDPTYTATMQVNEMVGDYTNRRVFVEPTKQTDIFGGKGEHKCGKCRSSNTNYTTAQTRKGDEQATVFNYCEDCGHQWKS